MKEPTSRLVSIQYAKQNLSALVDELEEGLDVVHVRRYGEPCFAMVSLEYMKYIEAILGTPHIEK